MNWMTHIAGHILLNDGEVKCCVLNMATPAAETTSEGRQIGHSQILGRRVWGIRVGWRICRSISTKVIADSIVFRDSETGRRGLGEHPYREVEARCGAAAGYAAVSKGKGISWIDDRFVGGRLNHRRHTREDTAEEGEEKHNIHDYRNSLSKCHCL